MMYPILCKVQYETLHIVFSEKRIWKQLAFSVFINWIVAPFFMVGVLCHSLSTIADDLASSLLRGHSSLIEADSVLV